MSRLFIAALVVVCTPLSVHALDPEFKSPYELNVVLHIAKHPVLTRVFSEQVERQLHDHLQGELQGLATVRVVHEHPLLSEVEEKGLQQALDNWRTVSGAKT